MRNDVRKYASLNINLSSELLATPTAAPGDDGEVRRRHAGAHEQDDVLMPGLPVVHHLLLKELEVILVVAVHLQQANGHLAVPAAFMHLPPATLDVHNIRCVQCLYVLLLLHQNLACITVFTLPMSSPSCSCS